MREEKSLLLEEVREQIDQFGNFTIVQYKGLTANKMTDLRKEVSKLGGEVQVIRKRILLKAAAAAGVNLDLNDLPGHIGLIYSGQDAVETTKFIFDFGKNANDALNVLGGRMDGQLYNAADVEAISKLPGRDQMRAQLLGLFVAPMSNTLSAMNALLTAIPFCLENKSKENS